MSSFHTKVSQLFGDRFGTQLVIKWSNPLSLGKDSLKDWQTTFVYSRTRRQVSFPIFSKNNQLRAIAIAHPVGNNDAVRFQEMSQFLQLTVTESLNAHDRLEVLENSEAVFQKSHNEDTNVIRWPANKKQSTTGAELQDETKKTYSFQPIWLYGEDHQLNLKVAYAAHEWVRNWAFINVKEIPDLFWQKKESWLSYAQMTILIPQVESLSERQWSILESNLKEVSNHLGPKPLILLTSQDSPEALRKGQAHRFKAYRTNSELTPKAQAHFLLFQQTEQRGWIHHCQRLKGLYFLPFGTTSDLLH